MKKSTIKAVSDIPDEPAPDEVGANPGSAYDDEPIGFTNTVAFFVRQYCFLSLSLSLS